MFTTNKFTDYVNIALNYPAISFDDIRLFLDQAIAEINTELHTSLPSVDEMEHDARETIDNMENLVFLTAEEVDAQIELLSSPPALLRFYYDTTKNQYGYCVNDEWKYFGVLYGYRLINGVPTFYKSGQVLANNVRAWYRDNMSNPANIDLENYFTDDWITLFLVPYVAFKYSVRDGDTGRLFNEEFSQGFQQLRHSYNVPFQVILATVADKFAYKKDVINSLPNLLKWVVTKAITKEMKNPQGVNATYRDFYDVGGFGL